jgi:hypothetical protein
MFLAFGSMCCVLLRKFAFTCNAFKYNGLKIPRGTPVCNEIAKDLNIFFYFSDISFQNIYIKIITYFQFSLLNFYFPSSTSLLLFTSFRIHVKNSTHSNFDANRAQFCYKNVPSRQIPGSRERGVYLYQWRGGCRAPRPIWTLWRTE